MFEAAQEMMAMAAPKLDWTERRLQPLRRYRLELPSAAHLHRHGLPQRRHHRRHCCWRSKSYYRHHLSLSRATRMKETLPRRQERLPLRQQHRTKKMSKRPPNGRRPLRRHLKRQQVQSHEPALPPLPY